jgi:hypothetical protein
MRISSALVLEGARWLSVIHCSQLDNNDDDNRVYGKLRMGTWIVHKWKLLLQTTERYDLCSLGITMPSHHVAIHIVILIAKDNEILNKKSE